LRLLFDQNLSDRLVERLDDLFPGSDHVKVLDLERSGDQVVWGRAHRDGYVLITKDRDFADPAAYPGPSAPSASQPDEMSTRSANSSLRPRIVTRSAPSGSDVARRVDRVVVRADSAYESG